jgi:tetratricopeptide (TPR) repeat protein
MIIVAWIVFVCSFAGLAYIVFSALPALRVVDVRTFKGSKEKQLKHDIVVRQIEQKTHRLTGVFVRALLPLWHVVQGAFRRFAHRVKELERTYQDQARGKQKQHVDKASLDAMAREASLLMDKERYDEAEKVLVEILSLQPKYAGAYELLGRMYIVKKELAHAHEALSTMLKLRPKDASAHAMMGELLRQDRKWEEALVSFLRAVELSPRNPKYLDFLIDAALHEKNLELARTYLGTLAEVNPDNQKIAEYKQKIDPT